MTSRELVLETMAFRNTSHRAPRQLWRLPWAAQNYPAQLAKIMEDFPDDCIGAPVTFAEKPVTKGDPYQPGLYTDEWNCTFVNIHPGVQGEVKNPIVEAEDAEWTGARHVHIPEEWLRFDADEVNRACAGEDRFVMGSLCPNPFERLQYIRGTENLYMDLLFPSEGMRSFIRKLHDFYCRQAEAWAKTDVDSIHFMDDWGSQKNTLISTELWCEFFKPLYRDYVQIAHHYGKKAFMHSDGYILPFFSHLIEIGVDAINSQMFCMQPEQLAPFAGKITFWGEIDRQYALTLGSAADVEKAVRRVYDNLWKNGGCFAQCEFTVGAKPENVRAVFETWDNLTRQTPE